MRPKREIVCGHYLASSDSVLVACLRCFLQEFDRKVASGSYEMNEKQVRAMMFAEVCNYRPCAEGKPGNVSRWGTALGQQMQAAQAKGGSDSKMDVDSKCPLRVYGVAKCRE